jgi:transcriptional adapter 2-alpha
MIRVKCAVCDDYDTCLDCFYDVQWGTNPAGKIPRPVRTPPGSQTSGSPQETKTHSKTHGYRICDSVNFPLFSPEWSIGEELLLIEGIQTFGLGNWGEISDHIGRLGSKTHKECMKHYLDVYMGRYGHCLPPTLVNGAKVTQGKIGVVVPHNASYGDPVGRNEAVSTSLNIYRKFEKATSDEERSRLVQEARELDLAMPFNIDTLDSLPGNELNGYMPRRQEYDVEFDNEAESLIGDMDILEKDTSADKELKLAVLRIYNEKIDEREKRKEFARERNLLDYAKLQEADNKRPRDELEVRSRARAGGGGGGDD